MTITILRQNGAQSFSPNPALAGGQMVVFKNTDSITHRVTLNGIWELPFGHDRHFAHDAGRLIDGRLRQGHRSDNNDYYRR